MFKKIVSDQMFVFKNDIIHSSALSEIWVSGHQKTEEDVNEDKANGKAMDIMVDIMVYRMVYRTVDLMVDKHRKHSNLNKLQPFFLKVFPDSTLAHPLNCTGGVAARLSA